MPPSDVLSGTFLGTGKYMGGGSMDGMSDLWAVGGFVFGVLILLGFVVVIRERV
jgi:hypothetical protein